MASNSNKSVSVDSAEPSTEQVAAWMVSYAKGDQDAFSQLYAAMCPGILRFHRRVVRNKVLAEDLTQKTFLKVHVARRRFIPGSPIKPWIYTIARNLQRDHFRKAGRSKEYLTEEGSAPDRAQSATLPEERDIFFQRKLKTALEALPASQRDVVVLHKFQQLSMAEVAEVLGIGLSAAKVRAHRAYAALRTLLGEVEK